MLDQGVVLEVIKHLLDYGSVISGGCIRFSDITLMDSNFHMVTFCICTIFSSISLIILDRLEIT